MATALRLEEQGEDAIRTPEVFRLMGRPYRRAASTSAVQDVFVTRRLRSSKIATALPTDDEIDDLTLAGAFEDAIWGAFESDIMYEILGGLLIEEGTAWTPAAALETAERIRALTDPREKDAIFEFAAEILLDFFMRAAISRRTSLRSSMQAPQAVQASGGSAGDPASDAAGRAMLGNLAASGSAATPLTTTASGTPSSERAPDGM